jgi:hypothetical protein
MSLLEDLLVGERIAAIHADSELTYVMLANGSQITIRGLVVVEPPLTAVIAPTEAERLAFPPSPQRTIQIDDRGELPLSKTSQSQLPLE